jgi:hypothetical protein
MPMYLKVSNQEEKFNELTLYNLLWRVNIFFTIYLKYHFFTEVLYKAVSGTLLPSDRVKDCR